MSNFILIDHPLVKFKISQLRDKDITTKNFIELVEEISSLMCYEITRDIKLDKIVVQTPLSEAIGYKIKGNDIVIVPILRAGLGMVKGIQNLIPTAKVGHIGIYRDKLTLKPIEYLCKLPNDLSNREIIILDPMLATGCSAIKAIEILKNNGGKNIKLACIVGCLQGVNNINNIFPDIKIFLAALDTGLDHNGYIIPGLGDAGDRMFGTFKT